MKDGQENSSGEVQNSAVCKRKITRNRREERREIERPNQLRKGEWIIQKIEAEAEYYCHLYELDDLIGKLVERDGEGPHLELSSLIARAAMQLEDAADRYVRAYHRLKPFNSNMDEY